MQGKSTTRRLPVGAEVLADGGVAFRVWADQHRSVDVVLEDGGGRRAVPLEPEGGGYFSGHVAEGEPGTRVLRLRPDEGVVVRLLS